MRRDAAALLLPFDEACGMGWGLDLIVKIEQAGLKMGIIDATPVTHALRRRQVLWSQRGACPHASVPGRKTSSDNGTGDGRP